MTSPVISVVIPTRNRPDTLEVCLRAMRLHQSPAIEIVVQDNSTNPATHELTLAAMVEDPRIRYSRAPYPTSQRHNFELGLAAATGQYLSIIGDDDGYSMGSLDWLAERLVREPVDAVRWNLLHYVWPSLSVDGEGFMDLLPTMCGGGCEVLPAAPLAEKVLRAETVGSWDNILVYHGMISRGVYERMKAQSGGIFFPYPMPDVYAHNVIPFFCERYLQVNDIVSIYGVSGHSAGASWTKARATDGTASAEGNRWMMESVADEVAQKLPWQPDIRTLRYHDFAALKVAADFNMLGGRVVDAGTWTKAIVTELKLNSTQVAAWHSAEPKAVFDGAIFDTVRSALPVAKSSADVAASNKKTADKRLPSLRVHAADPGAPDNVLGAMQALAALFGAEPARFEQREEGAKPSLSRKLFRTAAQKVRAVAPVAASRVLNSKAIPWPVWRYLKAMVYSEFAHSQKIALKISNLQKEYEKSTSTGRSSGH